MRTVIVSFLLVFSEIFIKTKQKSITDIVYYEIPVGNIIIIIIIVLIIDNA